MKDFIYGKLLEATEKETKNSGKACVVKLEVEGKWNPDTQTRPTETKTVWYFNKDNAPLADWALNACEKAVGKTVLLTATEYQGHFQGEDTPGTYKLCTVPSVLRTFENETDENDAFNAFDEALFTVKEKGLLPDDYTVDLSTSKAVKDCIKLLATIEGDEARAARIAAQKLLTYERNCFIGRVASVRDDPEKERVSLSVALPGTKEGEETKWASFVFDEKLRPNVLKVFTTDGALIKDKEGHGPRAVLFGKAVHEFNGRTYIDGTGFRRVYH